MWLRPGLLEEDLASRLFEYVFQEQLPNDQSGTEDTESHIDQRGHDVTP